MDPTHNHNLHNPPSATSEEPTQTEAGRLLGIAEKLLQSRDLTGAREFALLAQEMDPLIIEGSDQILAIADVMLASEKRVNNNRHQDWYSILQIERRLVAAEPDLLRRNYRRLALLLHPDKNKFPLADTAFKFVADAWAVLSDPSKRTPYDHELSLFAKVDLRPQPPASNDKLPVRRSSRGDTVGGVGVDYDNHNYHATPTTTTMPPPHGASGNSNPRGNVGRGREEGRRVSNFWTTCPYCYVLYEYPKVYEECCIRCQNCERAFHAASIPSLPPMVPGKEAYYCCWGFFPLGFSLESNAKGKKGGLNDNNNVAASGGGVNNSPNTGFPNWMPGMFTTPMAAAQGGGLNVNVNMDMNAGGGINVDFSDGSGAASMGYDGNVGAGYGNAMPGMSTPGPKKRGRPRKNPFPV